MYYRLRSGLHVCFLDDRAIFLDVTNGRYFAAAGQCARSLKELAGRGGSDENGRVDVSDLAARGLIESSEQETAFAPPREVDAIFGTSRGSTPSGSWRGTAKAALHQMRARQMTAKLTFAGVVAEIRHRKSLAMSANGPRGVSLGELAACHERAALFLGHADRCLPRSVALLMAAYALGHLPKFVIGVRAHPFAAHCWVQEEGMVLNDSIDHARLFTPIFVQ